MTARVVYDGSSDGVTLGAASGLAGAYGNSVAQAATIAAVATTASTSTTNAFGYTTSTQADAIVSALNSVLTALKNYGIVASS